MFACWVAGGGEQSKGDRCNVEEKRDGKLHRLQRPINPLFEATGGLTTLCPPRRIYEYMIRT